jgi:hypothetical protein
LFNRFLVDLSRKIEPIGFHIENAKVEEEPEQESISNANT